MIGRILVPAALAVGLLSSHVARNCDAAHERARPQRTLSARGEERHHRRDRGMLTIVGFADPAGREPGLGLGLAGGWSPARGWVAAPYDLKEWIATQWRAVDWQLFPRPDARPVSIRTRPLPDPAEALTCPGYTLTAPIRGGVAVHRAANPRPRVSRRERPDRPELRASTRQLLERQGVPPPVKLRIQEAWRVDLNGDGRDEVLWTSRSRVAWQTPYPDRPDGPVPGDYSLLGIRYLSGGSVQCQALALTAVREQTGVDPAWYAILCPLDINGDARMEILAHVRYFEEEEMLLFTFDGRRIVPVFSSVYHPLKNGVQ